MLSFKDNNSDENEEENRYSLKIKSTSKINNLRPCDFRLKIVMFIVYFFSFYILIPYACAHAPSRNLKI